MSTRAEKQAALRERIARLEQDEVRVAEKLQQAKTKLEALDAAPAADTVAQTEEPWRAGSANLESDA